MRILKLLLLLSFNPLHPFAQIIEPLGQSPSGIEWRQIKTRHFDIIFPGTIETDAQRIANAMDNAYYDVAASLRSLPRRIAIVMQNQTTDNNAFVSSEGRRAEFFSTPPQNPNNMGLNSWYDELSLHEYRHVVQMDQTRQGWGKYIFYLFGNSGTSIMQGLTNPWWFWEGDAVGCESAMGYGGRGRIPSFDLTFRTQLLSRGAFPYVKAACGSMKNAIPNHYLLGYLMTTYAKNHFGADVWSRILSRAYGKPPLPFSFSRSMKKITGLNAEEMYSAMTNEIKELWSRQTDSLQETTAEYFHRSSEKVFVNYKFPQYLPDGNIVTEKAGLETGSFLAYKSSIVDQSQFVLLTKEGKEKKIRISGVLDDNGMLSSAGDKVVWTEYGYDPRWGARNYTVIKVLDTKTKSIKQLSQRSRVHAPCFSPDGKMIAAIESSTGNQVSLILLDAGSGKLIKKFDNPGNQQYLQPHFTRDGHYILLALVQPGLKSIVKVDIESGKTITVLKPVAENISAPVDYENYVLYNSTRSGIDNIYAIDTLTGYLYQVTNRKYGAFNPAISPDNTCIAFQDFTPDGFRIAVMPLKTSEWQRLNPDDEPSGKVEYFKPFAKQEAGNILMHIPDSVYPVTPYKRFANAFKIYGWGFDPLTNLPQMSLGIRSQDVLSTTIAETGLRFDNNEGHWGKYFRISYNGLYPQFFFSWSDGKRKTLFAKGEADTSGIHYDLIAFRNFNLGMKLPLNLSGGPFVRKINLSVQGIYTSLSKLNYQINSKRFARQAIGGLYLLQYDASFEMRLRKSQRDVAPRFGTLLYFSLRNTPFNSFYQASQTAMDASFYLPGFFRHHSIKMRACLQQDAKSNYHFENRFDFFRNKSNELFHQLQIWSIDYQLPLSYPDLAVLKGLLYIQRLKAGFFTEWGFGKPASEYEQTSRYTNPGVELTGDVNFIRFLLPLEVGFRSSYLVQNHSVKHSFIFKVPLF